MKQIGLPLRARPILLITCMITDRIGLHSVLLPILILHCSCPSLFQEFDSKDTSYKIPKKTVSTDSKDRRMSSWIEIDPSFNKEDFLPQSNCRAGLSNEKQRSYGHHSTQRNEIGYRICRQAFFTPRRFKHADAPGWRDCTSPTSQQEKIFSCQGLY